MQQEHDFIKAREIRDVLVLEIIAPALNDFDIVNRIADDIEAAMRVSGLTKIAVNLEHIELLNSIGLVVFVRTLKSATADGRCVALCSPQHVVERSLKISRLAFQEQPEVGHLSVAADVESAVSSFDSQ